MGIGLSGEGLQGRLGREGEGGHGPPRVFGEGGRELEGEGTISEVREGVSITGAGEGWGGTGEGWGEGRRPASFYYNSRNEASVRSRSSRA